MTNELRTRQRKKGRFAFEAALADRREDDQPATPIPSEPTTPSNGSPDEGDTSVSPDGHSLRLPLDKIARNPFNPRGRVHPAEAQDIAGTLQEVGQLHPIVVATRKAFLAAHPASKADIGDADWIIVAGERRSVAARAIGWTDIEAVVKDRLITDGTETAAMIIENLQRRELSPLQEAEGFATLIQDGHSQRLIAKRVNVTQAHVSRRLDLLRLPTSARALLETKELSVSDAQTLVQAAKGRDGLVDLAWSIYAGDTGPAWAHHDMNSAIQAATREIAAEATKTAAFQQAAEENIEVVDPAEIHDEGRVETKSDITKARTAGTLVGVITEHGLEYYDRAKADRVRDRSAKAAAREKSDRSTARKATTSRRAAAARLAAKLPKQPDLLDALVAQTLANMPYDVRRKAAELFGADEDATAWADGLDNADDTTRKRAAWAVFLARQEITISSSYHRWTDVDRRYLELLAAADYVITDADRAKFDATKDTSHA